jgi:aerobic carbon-monoxide dehydrogenase large subunit
MNEKGISSDEGIGAAVRRKEDRRFLTGRGRYVHDVSRPGQVFAVFLRSPHAHANIRGIDVAAALASPRVIAVYTGADLVADNVGGVPCAWGIVGKDGQPMKEPKHPPLALGKVRHVGDTVAMVVAESLFEARDAAERIEVDYEVLPVAIDVVDAVKPGAPQLYDDVPGNVCCDWAVGDKAATDAAFARAHHITRLDVVNNRLVPNAMETRAALAEYDPGSGDYTLYAASQLPHVARVLIGALMLNIPEHKLRVVAPDLGGGFGSKQVVYAEEALVTWAAGKLERPVKWVADRSEAFISDAQGRDHATHAELALDKDGRFLGLRVSTLANIGAYISTFGPNIPTNLYGPLLAGVYRTPAIYCEVKVVFTNTVPTDAYRGAGRPEATYILERIVELAARETGIDRVDLRRRNFISRDQYPYRTPVLLEYDSGNHHATLDRALEIAEWATLDERRKEAARRGKLRGIGLVTYLEACGLAPSRMAQQWGARGGLFESANIRVHPTGAITAFTGAHSHGQGHETVFAQLVGSMLGVPIDKIEIVHGDTAKSPFGLGTYGSRSAAVGGSALAKAADKVIAKSRKIAAHLLEAAEQDIVFKDGEFRVVGTDRGKSFGEIAFAAYNPPDLYPLETLEPGLEETAFYDPTNFTFPGGCHIAEVEIDPESGEIELAAYHAVDDIGTVLNPLIVEGQIHGGVVQGVGQALFETCVYDRNSGQILTGSYMDYTMPRAGDVPNIASETDSTVCLHNPIGVKGCGECGTIAAPAAVMNAVLDALAPYGILHIDMPATPFRLWQAIASASAKTTK